MQIDDAGNVFGTRKGRGNGPTLVVSAHLDTVFPEGTNTDVKEKEGAYYAPGIADDGRGLAAIFSLIRAFNHTSLETIGDIIFAATVGEEGLGDLKGVKALFNGSFSIDGFISIEPGEPSRTTYLGTGSRRYSVNYIGKGGHSFGDFGLPSAIHAMGRAIADISNLTTLDEPKTTFTVGTVNGGTSINTIAEKANMMIDIRSTSHEELFKLEQQVLKVVERAADEENKRWGGNTIRVEYDLVGYRPAGSQAPDSYIVQAALAATRSLGFEPKLGNPSSTDSNVPISMGIPAVTLGGGGEFGGTHTLNEYSIPTEAFYGVQKIFLTILGLVGVDNLIEPLLIKLTTKQN
ncbi:M20/M25/M40 family metallo-hydrolase [Bacillus canaveralius]|uniref:M20/M25/M40 family metallo-hydrolase n=1 Tax=Bacillus canaveralius TaxID=1403243 RepID=UPI002698542D|nr:M20/M25/M40 family metallo-hydrolase [Bacillus canaveralius]